MRDDDERIMRAGITMTRAQWELCGLTCPTCGEPIDLDDDGCPDD